MQECVYVTLLVNNFLNLRTPILYFSSVIPMPYKTPQHLKQMSFSTFFISIKHHSVDFSSTLLIHALFSSTVIFLTRKHSTNIGKSPEIHPRLNHRRGRLVLFAIMDNSIFASIHQRHVFGLIWHCIPISIYLNDTEPNE